jgi:putative two-component system response regulator
VLVKPSSEQSAETRRARVLLVDDDQQTLSALGRILERAGHESVAVRQTSEARQRLVESEFALLLTDMDMPGESGLKLVEHALAEHPETAPIMLAGVDAPELARAGIELGTYGYISKPFTPNEVMIAVDNALRRRQLEIENRAHREALDQIVRTRTLALERSARQLKLTREEMVRRLSRAVEYRDEETGGHTERMSRYCAVLAQRAGHDGESLRIASPMHDVGKVAIPDHILLKPGRLEAAERREMERHTEIGHEILSGSGSALLELAATIAWTHHEKYDGTGYPRGLSGSAIPFEGRVAAIADVFDALTSARTYRGAFGIEQALQMMREERGRHFDPELLDLFLGAIDDIVEIRTRYQDDKVEARARSGALGVVSTASRTTAPRIPASFPRLPR